MERPRALPAPARNEPHPLRAAARGEGLPAAGKKKEPSPAGARWARLLGGAAAPRPLARIREQEAGAAPGRSTGRAQRNARNVPASRQRCCNQSCSGQAHKKTGKFPGTAPVTACSLSRIYDLHGRLRKAPRVRALETRADRYRRLGAECLTMIERATDDELREHFLEMAIAWHTLAVHAERRESVDSEPMCRRLARDSLGARRARAV
jgi:hypothetical protein